MNDATRLFEASKKGTVSGLPRGIENKLKRGGYGNRDENGSWTVDKEEIMSAVLDGALGNTNGIGEITMKAICVWLTKE